MNKYEINQKVEIFGVGIPNNPLDGKIVTVLELPGHNPEFPLCYLVRLPYEIDGYRNVRSTEKFLRPFPPKLPNGRADLDTPSSWAEFDKATGLDSSKFRYSTE